MRRPILAGVSIFVISQILPIVVYGQTAQIPQKSLLAIIDFNVEGNLSITTGKAAGEKIFETFLNSENYKPIERKKAEDANKRLPENKTCDQKCAAKLGKEMEVDYVVTGEISQIEAGKCEIKADLIDVAKIEIVRSASKVRSCEVEDILAAAQEAAFDLDGINDKEVGTLSIKSFPAYASVFIDNQYKGNTPIIMKLKPGNHLVLLEKENYKMATIKIEIMAGKTNKINLFLESFNDKTTQQIEPPSSNSIAPPPPNPPQSAPPSLSPPPPPPPPPSPTVAPPSTPYSAMQGPPTHLTTAVSPPSPTVRRPPTPSTPPAPSATAALSAPKAKLPPLIMSASPEPEPEFNTESPPPTAVEPSPPMGAAASPAESRTIFSSIVDSISRIFTNEPEADLKRTLDNPPNPRIDITSTPLGAKVYLVSVWDIKGNAHLLNDPLDFISLKEYRINNTPIKNEPVPLKNYWVIFDYNGKIERRLLKIMEGQRKVDWNVNEDGI